MGFSHLHVSSPPSEAQQLLVLAGDEVNGGVLQQGREDEEQTNCHPDVDGFDVGHLERGERRSELNLDWYRLIWLHISESQSRYRAGSSGDN